MFSGGVQNTGSNVNTQQKQVSSLIKHSSYSSASMKNDIMLIKLSFVSKISFVHSKKPANLRFWESEMILRSKSGLEDLRKVEFETKLDEVPTFRIITILRRLSCHLLQPLQSTQFVVGAIAVPLVEIQKNWLVLKDLTLLWILVMEGKYLIKTIQNSFGFGLIYVERVSYSFCSKLRGGFWEITLF